MHLAMAVAVLAMILCQPRLAKALGPDNEENAYVIMAYGDSLMAGHGIPKELAFPAQLEAALKKSGYNVKVINKARSGDTTHTGLKRLDYTVKELPDLVILGLGANDALRGVKPRHTREHLASIIYYFRSRGVDVLLAGMYAPPNMGAAYGAQFNGIYGELAQYYNIPLYPFLLHGVAGVKELNNDDGVHPNPEGVAVMVKGILPYVEKMLPDYIYVDPNAPARDPASYGSLD